MSTHDPTLAPSSTPVSSKETGPVSGKPQGTGRRNRSFLLLGVLALLLLALWYDYKVARPSVVNAYDSIGKINSDYNLQPGKVYVTEKEVQKTLNRKPSSLIQEGPYHIEVYSWRAGLPIRSHNYYAVYSAGTPLVFLKHYKFQLPMDELKSSPIGMMGGELTAEMRQDLQDNMEQAMKKQQEAAAEHSQQPTAGEPGASDTPSSGEPTKASPPSEEANASDTEPTTAKSPEKTEP